MHSRSFYTARTDDLVVQELGDELLIYDRQTDVAHCLSSVAVVVWRTCEGGALLDEIAQRIAANELSGPGSREGAQTLAQTAVTELEEKGLLVGHGSAREGISRRQALRRIAGVGAAALAAPLVVSAAVPKPAEAHGSPLHCVATGSGPCAPANSANATNNCCTSTGAYCTYQSLCSTTCIAAGASVGTCCTGNGCTSTTNTLCCSGMCHQHGNSGTFSCD